MGFSHLGLSEKVLAAIAAAGYEKPTPIQEKAIPHALEQRDVIGIAQTGTGKTASFVLPMLTLLERGRARARMPRTLILEPTRELAAQVESSFNAYGAQHKINVALLIGGMSFEDQERKLTRGVDVLIATPGRLLDHFERGKLLLTGVEILVIDEADRMLDMGFIPDIERICKLIPPHRQTLFFSATMPTEIRRLTEAFLRNPVQVEVAKPSTTAENITQSLAASAREPHAKRERLRELLRGAEKLQNALVFCNRKRDVSTLQRSLERHGFNAGALHGDMDQHARMATLERFRSGDLPLLVASDVAARGLDIPAVSHVINFDVPIHAEDYVHRIGRTGRAGRPGEAITIVTPEDRKYIAAIQKLTGQTIAYAANMAEAPPAAPTRERRPARGAKPVRSEKTARGEKPRRPEKPAPTEQRPVAAEKQPERSRHKDRPQQQPSDQRRGRNDRRRQEAEEPVIGLGDHVPAFLLRPVAIGRR